MRQSAALSADAVFFTPLRVAHPCPDGDPFRNRQLEAAAFRVWH
jgi:hypothetical protein